MGKIIVSTNVTVDGGVTDPTGEEGTPRGGWFTQIAAADREAFGQAALTEALAADAFLMGRRTYDFLASRWPLRTGALADRLNSMAKHVVSASLGEPAWHNTRVIRRDAMSQIALLKGQVDGPIVVPASFHLVQTMFDHDLVDELSVMVFPLILGAENPPFAQLSGTVPLRLLAQDTVGDHRTQIRYEVVRPS